ncbi:MAG: DUF4493 domain-containing protein [Bacteroidales bacterium]|nr:DUF4493 domain-containing protein [Bacteroidales bacterium]
MRNFFLLFSCALLALSCDGLMMPDGRKGTLRIHFQEADFTTTKAAVALPDTNAFILHVSDASGNTLYKGSFGAAPASMEVPAGNYTVSAVSCEFDEPLFDCPQWGDTQVVVVKAGEKMEVTLCCAQLNCGMRIRMKPEFLTAYPDGLIFLRSAGGKLLYGYSETRTAYFKTGNISAVLSDGGRETTLFTRRLEAAQILTVTMSVAANAQESGSIHIQVDTTRTYLSGSFTIGGGDAPGTEEKAYSVTQAQEKAGEEDVWVYGYIVGGDLSSSKCSFTAPFTSRTNIAIAAKSSCKDKEQCLSVQLSKGDIRDALNLVDNPQLLGRMVYLKGDIVQAYYGIPGIQNLSEFRIP